MPEDQDKKDMLPETLIDRRSPSRPLVGPRRTWGVSEIGEIRRGLSEAFDKLEVMYSKKPLVNGDARLARLDQKMGTEAQIDIKNLEKPSDAGLGLAEGQEPTNVRISTQNEPSSA